ncbi:hypothetical protein MHYP_G00318140 [Metynnis hypsauchen]
MQECVCYLGAPRSALMQLSDLGRKNILLRRTFQTELVQVEPRLSDRCRRENDVTTVLLGMRLWAAVVKLTSLNLVVMLRSTARMLTGACSDSKSDGAKTDQLSSGSRGDSVC